MEEEGVEERDVVGEGRRGEGEGGRGRGKKTAGKERLVDFVTKRRQLEREGKGAEVVVGGGRGEDNRTDAGEGGGGQEKLAGETVVSGEVEKESDAVSAEMSDGGV